MSNTMSLDQMKDATLITAKEHLEEVCVDLAKCDRLAFDTESNGFYAYKEKVCLIQISSPTEDFIVDPIAFKDISCLGPLFADPKIEILFHAGEYDVLCLKRDYGFTFTNLYDTMIAARILGTKELGLAAAIERHFGIVISKKLQRADWGKRPLTHEMIRYAQGDTHFLMRLADIQKKLLDEKGRMADAKEAFADLAELEPNVKTSSRDRAPFRVMPEDLMVKIAQAMPETREALAAVRGMTPYILERFGSGLLAAVEKGKASPPVTRPPSAPAERKRLSDLEWRTFEALRAWRKSRSEKDAVEPVVIMTTESLRTLAIHACRDHGGDPLGPLSDLKRSRYGEDILKVVATARAAKNGS
jgi:ribonuclease D